MTARCDAMHWGAARRECDGCGAPLTGRQQRWCAGDCAYLYWTNHRFSRAREVALARCQVWRRRSWSGVVGRVGRWRCERCGCTTPAPEVNHRRPALGAHAHESCVHHQENLEVLCPDCHRAETRRQHRAGELGRRPRRDASEQLALEVPA